VLALAAVQLDHRQRLIEIGDDIVDVFDADRKPPRNHR
jgi:hypothetical protein